MASEKQVAANRRNAQKSTGPRTPVGRTRAKLNALKHGLTAKELVIFDETEEDLSAFISELLPSLDLVGAHEEEIGQQIALAYWSARRARRAESGLFNLAGDHNGGVFQAMPQEMTNFVRFDAANARKIQNLLNQLDRQQARRRGESVPAPMVVTLSGAVETVAVPAARRQRPINDGQISMELSPPAPNTDGLDPAAPKETGDENCKTKPIG
jgi:type II secretory pathway component GspD/PulD (secretin)